ncbi:MAG: hypothetical protein QOG04_2126 [Actinomycetota bacterium]|jgi:phage shock protein C|nr:hypothetical protein [Actinomycetota bacterium]
MATGQLVRSTTDRKIAGVCAGLAAHFDIDVNTMRILWLLAVIVGGFGFLAYIILWIVLPEGDTLAGASRSTGNSAIRIAEERYARGEISSEELARMRTDLGG